MDLANPTHLHDSTQPWLSRVISVQSTSEFTAITPKEYVIIDRMEYCITS